MTASASPGVPIGPRKLVQRLGGADDPTFSICVMLTEWAEYHECMASFRARGFDDECCEFLVMDNSQANRGDAYVTLNEFLQAATGAYIIICHQDVVLLDDGRAELEARLAALEHIDPHWGLCGNAGKMDDSWPAIRIAYPDERTEAGALPARVVSLDENFLVARRVANLALSRDLTGFHHYASDLCVVADILGWGAYAIDFMLLHKSRGTFDASWDRSNVAIEGKYQRAFAPRWVHMNNGSGFFLSGSPMTTMRARAARAVGKLTGLVARNRELYDPVKRARRDRRRGGS